MNIRRQHPRFLVLVPMLANMIVWPASGQSTFSARDFLLNLSLQQGHDVSLESTGIPMVLTPGAIYLAASFQTSDLVFQGFLRKYDPSGSEIWTRPIPSNGDTFISGLAVDAGAVYLIGAIGPGHSEIFVRKWDNAGNEIWSRQFHISSGYHLPAGIVADSSGLYVAAWDGLNQGLVRKYSPAGDELWSHSITVRSMRGISLSDGIYVTGVNDNGGFVQKFTAGGDAVWTHQLTSTAGETVVPAAVTSDASSVYIGGAAYRRVNPVDITFIPSTGEAFLRRLDLSGNEIWDRRFGASGSTAIVSVAVDQTSIFIGGSTQSTLPGQCKAGGTDVFLRKYDTSGSEQWTRQFGTSVYDFPGNLGVDSTGVYFSGAVRGNSQTGAFLVKVGKVQSAPVDSKPAVSWECVVNAASYAGGGVAPGEIVTIFGRAMAAPDLITFRLGPDGRLASTLGSTRVLFNSVAAPLLYVSAGQLGAIVPNSVAASSTAKLEVEYQGVRSDALTLPVSLARPGIFAMNGSGIGHGTILNEDGTINSPQNPAARGSIVVVYMTGGGLTNPDVADGSIIGSPPPPSRQSATILFDDPTELGSISPAEVLFTGNVSQSVAGLSQVNVRVPQWVTPGDAVPIYLQVGSDLAEPGVTVSVR